MNDDIEVDEHREKMRKEFAEFSKKMAQRPFHRNITAKLISDLSDKEIETTMYDIVWAANANLDQLLNHLPRGYSLVYFTMVLENEVSNGGFNQLFHNKPQNFVDMTIKCYEFLGLKNVIEVINNASFIHKKEFAKKKVLWLKHTIEAFMKSYEFSALDDTSEKMWSLSDEIRIKRIEYIRANPEDFIGDYHDLYDIAKS